MCKCTIIIIKKNTEKTDPSWMGIGQTSFLCNSNIEYTMYLCNCYVGGLSFAFYTAVCDGCWYYLMGYGKALKNIYILIYIYICFQISSIYPTIPKHRETNSNTTNNTTIQ